jgi:hypothetical protein
MTLTKADKNQPVSHNKKDNEVLKKINPKDTADTNKAQPNMN